VTAGKSVHGTPLWIRIWHWAAAVLFLVLVVSGIVLTYSGSEFALMDYKLATDLHDITGIALAVIYGIFLILVMVTGYWRKYMRRWHGQFRRLQRQLSHVAKWSLPASGQRFRESTRLEAMQPLMFLFQQFLYLIAIAVLLPLLIVTGLFYLYPETAPETVMGFSGLWPMAMAHYVAGLLGTVFILFHIYISTIGGLRRMITGHSVHAPDSGR